MYRFDHSPLICSLFCLLACAGCSSVNGYAWRDRQWAKSPHLDRTRVVVLDSREEGRMPGDGLVIAPKTDVEKWTREALQKVPGTIDAGGTPNAAPIADNGRANMLCRVTIGNADRGRRSMSRDP